MARHDWDYWRHKYVSGDNSVTFEYLASLPNAPHLTTLKKQASQDAWVEQRKAFRHQVTTNVAVHATQDATVEQAVAQTQKLIDAAEMIARHVKMAKGLQSIILRKLQQMNPSELSPSALATWLKVSTDIERLALGMATEHTEIDFSGLSDEELEKLAKGE